LSGAAKVAFLAIDGTSSFIMDADNGKGVAASGSKGALAPVSTSTTDPSPPSTCANRASCSTQGIVALESLAARGALATPATDNKRGATSPGAAGPTKSGTVHCGTTAKPSLYAG
jgi:hypothetical protein